MLLNQLRYSVYVHHALLDEEMLSFPTSLEAELRFLSVQLMPSLSCTLLQHARHAAGVTIDDAMKDEVRKIKYTLPSAGNRGMTWNTYEAFILMNNLHSNFFSFLTNFFESYSQGFSAVI